MHRPVARAALKAYYYQRMSTPLPEEYAGQWARPMGHPDDEVLVHPSAASEARPEGTTISAPRGWYDAGDFNKYVVNSGISTYTLLALYEHYPDVAAGLTSSIPESGNGVPDVLDEALWNLRWMLDMQAPDGGVYHKLTQVDTDGTETTTETVDVQIRLTEAHAVETPYPNPVRQQATLPVTVRERQPVTVKLYDMLGRQVRTVHDHPLPGQKTKHIALPVADLSSGTYFVRVRGKTFTTTRRMTVVR